MRAAKEGFVQRSASPAAQAPDAGRRTTKGHAHALSPSGAYRAMADNSPAAEALRSLQAIADTFVAQRAASSHLGARRSGPEGITPSGSAPIQRTTVVIGYRATDDSLNASLNGLEAPNPVYFFSDSGEYQPSGPKERRFTLQAGEDRSKLHIVSHGSPGELAEIKDLDSFLAELTKRSVLTSEVTEVRLGACYALMRTDIQDASVALRVAKWVRANLNTETQQAVDLVAAFTANSGGAFVRGEASAEPLDHRSTLGASSIQSYLKFEALRRLKNDEVVQRLKKANVPLEGLVDELTQEAAFAATDAVQAIADLSPEHPPTDRTSVHAERIAIGPGRRGVGLRLNPGYTIASVTKDNFETFPDRVIKLESLEAIGDHVKGLFEAAVRRLVDDTRERAVARSQRGFRPVESGGGLGSGGAVNFGGYTFGGGGPTTSGSIPSFTFGSQGPSSANQTGGSGGAFTFGVTAPDARQEGANPNLQVGIQAPNSIPAPTATEGSQDAPTSSATSNLGAQERVSQ